jgi:sorbitol/mannitol transport system substrate-binding protein
MICRSDVVSLRRDALRRRLAVSIVAGIGLGIGGVAYATTVTIAVPNNNDLIEMKKLSPVFEKANPDIQLKWIVLEENVLRQRLTTDITTNGGQFDVAAIGTYEAPLWGKRGWLVPVTGLPASYDLDDVLKSVRDGLSYHGTLYALPFNAESSMTFYRKDLFAAASTKTCRS